MKRKANQFEQDVKSLRDQALESINEELVTRNGRIDSVEDATVLHQNIKFAQSFISNKVDLVYADEDNCGEVASMGTEDAMACGLIVDVDLPRLFEYEPTLIPKSKLNMIGDKSIVSVAAGGLHSVCLHRDGTVSSWGANDEKALGRGDIDEDDLHKIGPMRIKNIIQISAGDNHTTLLDIHGNVHVCGHYKDMDSGTFRDLLNPQDTDIKSKNHEYPVKVLGLGEKIMAIDAGTSMNAALDADGSTLYTWGMGNSGELARSKSMGAELIDGTFVDSSGREKCPYKTYELKKPFMGDTTINGYQYNKKLIRDKFLTPGPVEWAGGPNLKRQVLSFSCGDIHLLVVAYNRCSRRTQVFSSGHSGYGQLGHGDTKEVHELTPIEALNNMQISKVAAGNFHSLAMSMSGRSLFSWGKVEQGALGLFDEQKTLEYEVTDYIAEPKEVAFPTDLGNSCLVDIAAGDTSSFAITDGGDVYSWGYNENSQTGHYNVPEGDKMNKATHLVSRPRLLDVITSVNRGLERSQHPVGAKKCCVIQAAGGSQHSLMVIKRYT